MELVQPQAIRTIFFDAGYTLLYPYPSIPEVCQRVCQDIGLHIHLDQMKMRMRTVENIFFRQLRADRNTWANEDAIQGAIVVPLLLILVLGVFEFSWLIDQQHLISTGIHDAARYLAQSADPNDLAIQRRGARIAAVSDPVAKGLNGLSAGAIGASLRPGSAMPSFT